MLSYFAKIESNNLLFPGYELEPSNEFDKIIETLCVKNNDYIAGMISEDVSVIHFYEFHFVVKCDGLLDGVIKLRKLIWDQIHLDIEKLPWCSYGIDEESALTIYEDYSNQLGHESQIVTSPHSETLNENEFLWYDITKETLYKVSYFCVKNKEDANKYNQYNARIKIKEIYDGYVVYVAKPVSTNLPC